MPSAELDKLFKPNSCSSLLSKSAIKFGTNEFVSYLNYLRSIGSWQEIIDHEALWRENLLNEDEQEECNVGVQPFRLFVVPVSFRILLYDIHCKMNACLIYAFPEEKQYTGRKLDKIVFEDKKSSIKEVNNSFSTFVLYTSMIEALLNLGHFSTASTNLEKFFRYAGYNIKVPHVSRSGRIINANFGLFEESHIIPIDVWLLWLKCTLKTANFAAFIRSVFNLSYTELKFLSSFYCKEFKKALLEDVSLFDENNEWQFKHGSFNENYDFDNLSSDFCAEWQYLLCTRRYLVLEGMICLAFIVEKLHGSNFCSALWNLTYNALRSFDMAKSFATTFSIQLSFLISKKLKQNLFCSFNQITKYQQGLYMKLTKVIEAHRSILYWRCFRSSSKVSSFTMLNIQQFLNPLIPHKFDQDRVVVALKSILLGVLFGHEPFAMENSDKQKLLEIWNYYHPQNNRSAQTLKIKKTASNFFYKYKSSRKCGFFLSQLKSHSFLKNKNKLKYKLLIATHDNCCNNNNNLCNQTLDSFLKKKNDVKYNSLNQISIEKIHNKSSTFCDAKKKKNLIFFYVDKSKNVRSKFFQFKTASGIKYNMPQFYLPQNSAEIAANCAEMLISFAFDYKDNSAKLNYTEKNKKLMLKDEKDKKEVINNMSSFESFFQVKPSTKMNEIHDTNMDKKFYRVMEIVDLIGLLCLKYSCAGRKLIISNEFFVKWLNFEKDSCENGVSFINALCVENNIYLLCNCDFRDYCLCSITSISHFPHFTNMLEELILDCLSTQFDSCLYKNLLDRLSLALLLQGNLFYGRSLLEESVSFSKFDFALFSPKMALHRDSGSIVTCKFNIIPSFLCFSRAFKYLLYLKILLTSYQNTTAVLDLCKHELSYLILTLDSTLKKIDSCILNLDFCNNSTISQACNNSTENVCSKCNNAHRKRENEDYYFINKFQRAKGKNESIKENLQFVVKHECLKEIIRMREIIHDNKEKREASVGGWITILNAKDKEKGRNKDSFKKKKKLRIMQRKNRAAEKKQKRILLKKLQNEFELLNKVRLKCSKILLYLGFAYLMRAQRGMPKVISSNDNNHFNKTNLPNINLNFKKNEEKCIQEDSAEIISLSNNTSSEYWMDNYSENYAEHVTKAFNAFESVAQLEPQNCTVWYFLSFTALHGHDLFLAHHACQNALQLDRSNVFSWLLFATSIATRYPVSPPRTHEANGTHFDKELASFLDFFFYNSDFDFNKNQFSSYMEHFKRLHPYNIFPADPVFPQHRKNSSFLGGGQSLKPFLRSHFEKYDNNKFNNDKSPVAGGDISIVMQILFAGIQEVKNCLLLVVACVMLQTRCSYYFRFLLPFEKQESVEESFLTRKAVVELRGGKKSAKCIHGEPEERKCCLCCMAFDSSMFNCKKKSSDFALLQWSDFIENEIFHSNNSVSINPSLTENIFLHVKAELSRFHSIMSSSASLLSYSLSAYLLPCALPVLKKMSKLLYEASTDKLSSINCLDCKNNSVHALFFPPYLQAGFPLCCLLHGNVGEEEKYSCFSKMDALDPFLEKSELASETLQHKINVSRAVDVNHLEQELLAWFSLTEMLCQLNMIIVAHLALEISKLFFQCLQSIQHKIEKKALPITSLLPQDFFQVEAVDFIRPFITEGSNRNRLIYSPLYDCELEYLQCYIAALANDMPLCRISLNSLLMKNPYYRKGQILEARLLLAEYKSEESLVAVSKSICKWSCVDRQTDFLQSSTAMYVQGKCLQRLGRHYEAMNAFELSMKIHLCCPIIRYDLLMGWDA